MHRSDPGSGGTAASVASDSTSNQVTRTILLVEDEAFVREVAYEVLSRAGYRVLTAGNATEALQAFREHAGAVQLLLTDVVLPDRNGCDLALELAALCDGVKSISSLRIRRIRSQEEGCGSRDGSTCPSLFQWRF